MLLVVLSLCSVWNGFKCIIRKRDQYSMKATRNEASILHLRSLRNCFKVTFLPEGADKNYWCSTLKSALIADGIVIGPAVMIILAAVACYQESNAFHSSQPVANEGFTQCVCETVNRLNIQFVITIENDLTQLTTIAFFHQHFSIPFVC